MRRERDESTASLQPGTRREGKRARIEQMYQRAPLQWRLLMTFAFKLRAHSLSLSHGSHCQPRVKPVTPNFNWPCHLICMVRATGCTLALEGQVSGGFNPACHAALAIPLAPPKSMEWDPRRAHTKDAEVQTKDADASYVCARLEPIQQRTQLQASSHVKGLWHGMIKVEESGRGFLCDVPWGHACQMRGSAAPPGPGPASEAHFSG